MPNTKFMLLYRIIDTGDKEHIVFDYLEDLKGFVIRNQDDIIGVEIFKNCEKIEIDYDD